MALFDTAIRENERWLMERILFYAKQQGYTKYTSTLVEAWRVSIAGLSDAIIGGVERYGDVLPEFKPEERFEDDPMTRFGVMEARLHRERGVSLPMFLGLYKYYRYSFMDLVEKLDLGTDDRSHWRRFVERCFDRMEIAFCTQWMSLDDAAAIAELQETNRRMTNEKNKYLTLFESLDLPTFLVDEDGRLENLNVPAAELMGGHHVSGAHYYSLEKSPSMHERPLAELLPWLEGPLERLLHGREPSFEVQLEEPADSGGRAFSAMFSRMRDVSGKFGGGVVVLEDITERLRLERLKGDVERITRHDMKIPLSGMLTVFNCLLEGDVPGEQRELLALGRDSGYRMLDMINRSLDLYKIEQGTYRFEPQRVDLRMVIDRILEHARGLSEGHGVSLAVDMRADDAPEGGIRPMVMADEMLLYSALGNLVANALEASPVGREVVINVCAEDTCRIAIRNEGGVPDDVRETFFEKYATSGKKDGTGLGTYSARLLVETMGGGVSMHSDHCRTEVLVYLPLAADLPA